MGNDLPRYKCHKEVSAAKIAGISLEGELGFADYSSVKPSREWLDKNNPAVGGYYVVYADGYASYSPAQAFEEGYTVIK